MNRNEKLEKYSFQELEELYKEHSIFLYDEWDENLDLEHNRNIQYEKNLEKNFEQIAIFMDPNCGGMIPLRFLGVNWIPLDVAVFLSIVSSLGTEIELDDCKVNMLITKKQIWDARFEQDIRIVIRKIWSLPFNTTFFCKLEIIEDKILFAITLEDK